MAKEADTAEMVRHLNQPKLILGADANRQMSGTNGEGGGNGTSPCSTLVLRFSIIPRGVVSSIHPVRFSLRNSNSDLIDG